MGMCDYSKCTGKHEDLLYRVKDKFICGKCLDDLDKKMTELGIQ